MLENESLKRDSTLLFVTPSAYPLGGVSVWLQYIVDGLSKQGWQCWVGLVEGAFHNTNRYLSEYKFQNIILISNKTNTRYGRVKAIEKAIEKVSADIVVSVNIPDVFEAVTQLKNHGRQTKAVMTLHGLELDYFKDISLFKEQIDAVIVTNKLTESMVHQYSGFEQQRVIYSPYGVKMPSIHNNKKRGSPVVLAYVGRITTNQKRCRDLIELVHQLEEKKINYQLKLIGDGDERENLLQELNRETKLGEVVFEGIVTNEKLTKQLFPTVDLLILTSDWETGPIVIWEAMASGVVVVSSNYIGSGIENSLLKGENCYMFDIGDMKSAAHCIDDFINSDNGLKYQNAGYKLVEKKYSRQISIMKWNNALELIDQKISIKRSLSKIKHWPRRSAIEKWFSPKIDYLFRKRTGRQAYAASPGDEWPHSYSLITKNETEKFQKLMVSLDE